MDAYFYSAEMFGLYVIGNGRILGLDRCMPCINDSGGIQWVEF
jgi:hypothetical protein